MKTSLRTSTLSIRILIALESPHVQVLPVALVEGVAEPGEEEEGERVEEYY